MEQQELDEIRKRAEAATPGPWLVGPSPYKTDHLVADVGYDVVVAETPVSNDDGQCVCDALFIACAKTDVPRLLAEIERLRNSLIEIRDLARTGLPPSMVPAEYWPEYKCNRIAAEADAALKGA